VEVRISQNLSGGCCWSRCYRLRSHLSCDRPLCLIELRVGDAVLLSPGYCPCGCYSWALGIECDAASFVGVLQSIDAICVLPALCVAASRIAAMSSCGYLLTVCAPLECWTRDRFLCARKRQQQQPFCCQLSDRCPFRYLELLSGVESCG
jgi:hypothetical protein